MASFSAAKQSSEREHDRGAKFTTRNQILAGLLFAFGFPMLPISRWEHEFAGVWRLVAYDVIWWAAVGVTLLYVHFVERRPLTSIGFHGITWRGIAIAIGAAAVMVGGLAFIYYVIFPAFHMDESSEIHKLLSTPLWWLVISTVRAGVSEEVLYRGYAMERLGELTGSRTLAGMVSCALFAFAHVGPWGWPHLLVAGFGGAVLTVLYLWRGNLWVNIVTHIIVDGVGVLAG